MADPKIALDYVRTLIWPLIVIGVLLLFQDDIRGMLSRGVELEVLGVTIKGASGEQLAELHAKEQRLRDAIDKLQGQLQEQARVNDELTARLQRLGEPRGADTAATPGPGSADAGAETARAVAYSRDLQQDIQRDLSAAQMILGGSRAKSASAHEREGFEQILAGRWSQALDSFRAAYLAYPELHNVDEIQGLLARNLDALQAGDLRVEQAVLGRIVERYSWGAPPGVVDALRERLRP